MKKLSLLLCLALSSGLCFAQRPIWECHSTDECLALVDSLMKLAKHEYRPDSLRFPETARKYIKYRFIEKNPTTEEPRLLSITFRYYMQGEDLTLEIEGTPTYEITLIQGAYLDLFPMWKGWIDPDADLRKIAADKSAVVYTGPKSDRHIFEQVEERKWLIH